MTSENAQKSTLETTDRSADSQIPTPEGQASEAPPVPFEEQTLSYDPDLPELDELADTDAETAHVLFMDIVGFSRLPTNQQKRVLQQLQEIVRNTGEFRRAQAADQLIRLPTGDGMALVFLTPNPMTAVKCAQQVCKAIQNTSPKLALRMGINSGPVYRVLDVDDKKNITGEGINTAQRVMDCGDADHILLSDSVANFLKEFDFWEDRIQDLGLVTVKHGKQVHVFNLCAAGLGKQKLPKKVQAEHKRRRVRVILAGVAAMIVVGILLGYWYYSSRAITTLDSVVVLPFINISADVNTEYLSDGLTENIINNLSQLRELRVIARSTAFRYKSKEIDPQNIGRELGVHAVLMGRVVQRGDVLTVQTELVNVATGGQMWGAQYNHKFSDIFGMQEEIAKQITQRLRNKLTTKDSQLLAKRHTRNIDAYQAYLKGRYHWNKRTAEGLNKSLEYFNQAIEFDASYALAYAGLADTYILLGTYNILPTSEALPKAKAAAESALQIDETLVEAHTSMARVKADYEWKSADAEAEFKRALELNPGYPTAHHWYALHLMTRKRFGEALTEIKEAQNLDPFSPSINVSVGLIFFWSREYNRAIEEYRKTLELDPNFALAHVLIGQAYEQKGMHAEAIAELKKAVSLDNTPQVLAILGHAYASAGQKDKAQKVLTKLQEESKQHYVSPYFTAMLYAGLGEKDKAFEHLEEAYESRSGWLVWLAVEPRLDILRSDERFRSLERRLGFAL